jgi:transcriptional regulator with XRE-family HTH domain
MKSSEKSGEYTVSVPVVGSRAELGARVSAVVELFDTRIKAAEAAGISTDQLARYASGESEVSFTPIARLCTAKGISLDWLATGEGDMNGQSAVPQVNVQLLSTAIEAIEELVNEEKLTLTPEKKGKSAGVLYELARQGIDLRDIARNILKLAE